MTNSHAQELLLRIRFHLEMGHCDLYHYSGYALDAALISINRCLDKIESNDQ